MAGPCGLIQLQSSRGSLPLARVVRETLAALWHGYGTGWIAVFILAVLFCSKVWLTSRDLRKQQQGIGRMRAMREAVRPAWESSLNRIGIACWIGLFTYQFGADIWKHHQQLIATISSDSEEIEKLRTQLAIKPSVITQQVPLPLEPSLMTPTTMFTMIGAIRMSVGSRQPPVEILTSSDPGNERFRNEFGRWLSLNEQPSRHDQCNCS
jgi:hypothetical protein